MSFQIDWANFIVRSKFTVFALFYYTSYLRAIFKVQAPGDLIFGGAIERFFFFLLFLRYRFGGLIFGGVYSEFYGNFWLPSAEK